jgi:hypothetical protein
LRAFDVRFLVVDEQTRLRFGVQALGHGEISSCMRFGDSGQMRSHRYFQVLEKRIMAQHVFPVQGMGIGKAGDITRASQLRQKTGASGILSLHHLDLALANLAHRKAAPGGLRDRIQKNRLGYLTELEALQQRERGLGKAFIIEFIKGSQGGLIVFPMTLINGVEHAPT